MVSTWADLAPLFDQAKTRGSQKRVASQLGLTEPTLSNYMSGRTAPDPLLAARIASAFGIDLTDAAGVGGGSFQFASARALGGVKTLDGVGVPLVAIDVAAGDGALTPIEDLDDGAVYFFHEAWMRKVHGWNEKQRDRFCLYQARE